MAGTEGVGLRSPGHIVHIDPGTDGTLGIAHLHDSLPEETVPVYGLLRPCVRIDLHEGIVEGPGLLLAHPCSKLCNHFLLSHMHTVVIGELIGVGADDHRDVAADQRSIGIESPHIDSHPINGRTETVSGSDIPARPAACFHQFGIGEVRQTLSVGSIDTEFLHHFHTESASGLVIIMQNPGTALCDGLVEKTHG